MTQGLRARPIDIAGYGEEDDAEDASDNSSQGS